MEMVKNGNKLTVKTIELKEIGLPSESCDINIKIVQDKIINVGRWSIDHLLVLKINDEYYQTEYSVGVTEEQDETPWEYQDQVEFVKVYPVEVKEIKYLPARSDQNE